VISISPISMSPKNYNTPVFVTATENNESINLIISIPASAVAGFKVTEY
jgi:hypothetical protein